MQKQLCTGPFPGVKKKTCKFNVDGAAAQMSCQACGWAPEMQPAVNPRGSMYSTHMGVSEIPGVPYCGLGFRV